MLFLKRTLRIGIPFVSIALAVTMYAQNPSPANCGHPSAMTRFLHTVGLAHLAPCQTDLVPNGVGEWCTSPGHHCNDGSGPGKCQSVFDPEVNAWSCECIK